MNKKFLKPFLLVLVVLLFFPIFASRTNSQDTNSTNYQSYILQLEQYQRSHNRYVLDRSNYLKFKTLASEEQAIESTRDMLIQRDDVVIAYVNLLLDEVQDAEGLDEQLVSQININLQREQDWFEEHNSLLRSAVTLEELVEDSTEARERYDDLTEYIYKVFAYLSYGKVYDFHSRLVDTFGDIRAKFEQIRNEEREEYLFSDNKNIRIDNWLTESQSSINRSEERLNEIKSDVDEIEGLSSREYAGIVSELQDARLHMQKATSFLEEVIREIKTKEE